MTLEARMSDVLSEFARTLVTDFSVQGILDHLVHRIVDVLPIDAAGVTLISAASEPRFIAASDDAAMRFERLQTELREGPCLAANASARPVSIPDLAEDARFPRFAERALEEGLVAVFTFPLRAADLGLGALDLYRESAGSLSHTEMAAAQTLADVATAYLLNAQARVDLQAVQAAERDTLELLRLVDHQRTEYLTTVIHELRTPMTSIAGYTELLHGEDAGDLNAGQHKLLAAIERNSRRLTALADDLLTLTRLEGGPVLGTNTSVDLRAVVRAAQSALEALIGARGLQVTFKLPPGPVLVDGNVRDLERLVSNLLTNAVKFTEDGGWVRCTLRSVDATAFLEVSDNGIGIPHAERSDLFTRFFRASNAQKQAIPGSGLGLNIVESVAHNHGGTVSVVSAPGRGTTFLVDLPLSDDNDGLIQVRDDRRHAAPAAARAAARPGSGGKGDPT